jgi:methionine synthase / methylenetetrahydrofolate reductase(NADPH)
MATSQVKSQFLSLLADGPLLFDGAMGTEIANKGILPTQCYEELNISNPELIRSIHKSYVAAGANVIQTNTFGANRHALARRSLESQTGKINAEGVAIARSVADDGVMVAGSVSPAGCFNGQRAGMDACSRDDLLDAFAEQIGYLRDAGVDLLVLESFEEIGVMELALIAARREAPYLPVVAQLRLTPPLLNAGSDAVDDAFRRITGQGADVIGLNCGIDPVDMYPILQRLKQSFPGVPLTAQPSIGPPKQVDGRLLYSSATDLFATFAKRFLKLGVSVVGGCCGTTPDHIRSMSGAVRMAQNQTSSNGRHAPTAHVAFAPASAPTATVVPDSRKIPLAESSNLGALLGQRFVVSVEVNPPASLDYSRAVRAAQKLIDGGATVINTTDGARAALRMDNLTFASIVQREVGCETILHVCCRDRNSLGTVSHLLGAHAHGVHNLVVITGDPPKMGDFPDATAVYDMDSIGLLKLLSGLNAGYDPAGRELKAPTQFVCGTGVEPAAEDYARELDRLYQKVEAGADFVMTQPVYEPETMDRLLADTRDLGVPILMGIVPLASERNAEFVHANVPGMSIPDKIRARMRQAGNGPEARDEGVQIAIEAIEAVRDRVAGAYIIPPLGQYDSAVKIIHALGLDDAP